MYPPSFWDVGFTDFFSPDMATGCLSLYLSLPLQYCFMFQDTLFSYFVSLFSYFRLAVQKEQFLKKKETLLKEIHTKKEFLDSLQPRLENILKVHVADGH